MAEEEESVRVEERLKIKIGEAKNLPPRSHSQGGFRDVFCTLSLDQEEIYRTSTVERTLSPFYGEEFEFEVPRRFRWLAVYVRDMVGPGTSRVIGKAALRRQQLLQVHGKDHWFPLRPVDADSEVQGKAHLELRLDRVLTNSPTGETRHRLCVKLLECADLSVKNGACDPYATVTLLFSNSRRESRKSRIKKKTTSPVFDETFVFELPEYDRDEGRGSVRSRTTSTSQLYRLRDCAPEATELRVALWHDTAGTTEAAFLGEVRLPLLGLLSSSEHRAWYMLQPREPGGVRTQTASSPTTELGSLRLRIHYTADHVLPSSTYADLRELLLSSPSVQPISSSAAFVLGEIVGAAKQDAAQPLVRFFMHHGQLVPLIHALAQHEISRITDANTIFRGNSLASKLVDELMRVSGPHYLRGTLRPVLDCVLKERKPCEVDPTRLERPEDVSANLANLKEYVDKIFSAITGSALQCPALMCEAFHELKQIATSCFPENREVRYSVISGFIFLRFFAPAILGPRLFDLTTETIDPQTRRTLTLISKTVQSLGNLVSCRGQQSAGCKEEYMAAVHRACYTDAHIQSARQFLEIISASSSPDKQAMAEPVMLKEGMLIKRAQGRKRFGRKNFKKRFFRLTTQDLSYSKTKGQPPLCCIPLPDILAVERLQEDSFRMKNMFQVVQPASRALYVQANNCVEEKEWVDLLTKICQTNQHRLRHYHPAAYLNNHWLCCHAVREDAEGCRDVTSGLQGAGLQLSLDPDRELERIHSLFATHLDRLNKLQAACEHHAVYSRSGQEEDSLESLSRSSLPLPVDDIPTCIRTLRKLEEITASLAERHRIHLDSEASRTQLGTKHAPIGDDNYLLLTSRANLRQEQRIEDS